MPVGTPPAIYYSKTEKKQLKQPDKFINKLTLPETLPRYLSTQKKKNKPSSKEILIPQHIRHSYGSDHTKD